VYRPEFILLTALLSANEIVKSLHDIIIKYGNLISRQSRKGKRGRELRTRPWHLDRFKLLFALASKVDKYTAVARSGRRK